ncbi:MAG TPA: ricin-type beta-trefoil lectin domain protein, partial [Trebonia sp.]
NRAHRRVRRSGWTSRTGIGATFLAAMSVAALAGLSLASAGGSQQAGGTSTTRLDSSLSQASAPAPSPAEGHSPQLNRKLSGPLTGTGAARSGSPTQMSTGMRQATAAAASTMVNGIDVASVQHPHSQNSDINWASVAGAGYKFAAIKATEANYYTNPYYVYDAQNAVSNGMYVAPYAFVNAYNSTDAAGGNGTPVTQADDALQYAAKAENATSYTVGGKYLPLMLDIEYDPYQGTEHVNECYGLSASAMVTWISEFTAEVKAKTGTDPIIYTTQDWWATCTGNNASFGNDVLWVAAYSSGTPGTLPAGWNTWNMWQYTNGGTDPNVPNVPGISVATDLDYFSGAPETEQTTVNTAATPVQIRTLSALAGQTETYTAAGLPPGVTMSSSGNITGTPTTVGTYNVTVTPSATGTVEPTSVSLTWQVTGMKVTSPGNQSTTAGAAVNLQVSASAAAPSFTATGLPPGLSISSSGKITGWPDTPGTYTATVTATDSAGESASASFTWTVSQAANSGPAGKVVLANGGKCLDDTGSSTANGNKIQIYTCNGGTAQKWTVAQDGTLRAFGKCLDVTGGGTANGTTIQLWTCLSGDKGQQWQVGTGTELINPHSGKCLDDPYSRTANGTKLDIWTCNGGSQQHWTLPAGPAASGVAGKCLDDTGGSTANGNKIQSYACNGGASQAWTVMPDGTVRVSGKCLDVTGGAIATGTKIQLWSCISGDKGQQWQVTTTSDMAGELINPNSGLCLADPADSTANGTQMVIQSCTTTDPGESWHIQ